MTTTEPDWLKRLHEEGVLADIDFYFGKTLQGLCPGDDPLVPLLGALTSRAVQAGHVCLDLEARSPLIGKDAELVAFDWPSRDRCLEAMSTSEAVSLGERFSPLVLQNERRLYLHRYADYEKRLRDALDARASGLLPVDEALLKERFVHHFGPLQAGTSPEQRVAALLCTCKQLSVISGGPGTGKTTTVAKMLLLLQEHAIAKGPPLSVQLLAPTGKAAQRLSESIARGLAQADTSDEVRNSIPTTASTIHRALGYSRRTPTRFYKHRDNPLTSDVVIVDEASMVDLALMTKLVEAIPRHGRLILLGDKDQLASVEAGAIFGDILGKRSGVKHSAEFAQMASHVLGWEVPSENRASGMCDATIHLEKSYRYDENGGIGRVAAALRRQDPNQVVEALRDGAEASLLEPTRGGQSANATVLREAILKGYRAFGNAKTPLDRLAHMQTFRVLSPHRRGPLGVEELNALCEAVLLDSSSLRPQKGPYDGCPIMVTENDYQQELFNGDVGVLGYNAEGTRLLGYFGEGESLRTVPLSRLPRYETVFAMTVHKSQGSEFDHVLLVLPQEASPVLTRELLYTAITRAKKSVSIFGSREVLERTVRSGIQRTSGLSDKLWQ